ncbi:Prenylcysteine oxidase-like [Chamberlinius hualienensis]
MITLKRYVLTFAAVCAFTRQICGETAPRIAIVGAGIGGASASHFLKTLFDTSDLTVHIYESKKIGGRLATTVLNNNGYEIGGSVIHPQNKYMSDFLQLTGLKKKGADGDRGVMGLYNGKEFVFSESHWRVVNVVKMLWRYGMSIFKWEKVMDDTLKKFSKIYELQEKGYAYSTVDQLLTAMSPNFLNSTQISIRQVLKKLQFSDKFIDELLMAITRVNYGQTPDVNGFVGLVALAGATPNLWSVEGGNHLVAEKLLQSTGVDLIPETVVEVVYQESNKTFSVVSAAPEFAANINDAPSYSKRRLEYDIVIIATPLIDGVSRINFTAFPTPIKNFKGRYQRTVTTIVEGDINRTYLNLDDKAVDSILTTSTEAEFNSLSRIFPVSSQETENMSKVWKVFSQLPLTDQQLDNLFASRLDTQVIDWLAYPHYTPPEELQSFLLQGNLPIFYTSAIEWAASAMEMSCIAGRNAALLAHHYWHKNRDAIDKIPHLKVHREL